MDERGYRGVVGHKDVIRHLVNAAANDKVSHAYLLTGEKGSGKKLLASIFAAALNCETHSGEPCFKCASCHKALTGNHPDIIRVVHERPDVIRVNEIREQLVNTVDIKPYESRYKVYIIDEAEKMNAQSQNAILKTIEEPPPYAVMLLLANNPDSLLSTILSRCVRLNLKAVPSEDVRQYLMREMMLPDYEAEIAAAFAQGNIGRARMSVTGDAFAEMTEKAIRLVKKAGNMQTHEIVAAVKELSEDKKNIQQFFDILTLWFRDVLLYKATRDTDNLVFRRELAEIKREATICSYEGLEDMIEAVNKAGVRIRANVNFDLTVELLFLTIADNIKE